MRYIRYLVRGGEGGIRTHGTVARTPHFECGTIDHSATSPEFQATRRRTARSSYRKVRVQTRAWPPRCVLLRSHHPGLLYDVARAGDFGHDKAAKLVGRRRLHRQETEPGEFRPHL